VAEAKKKIIKAVNTKKVVNPAKTTKPIKKSVPVKKNSATIKKSTHQVKPVVKKDETRHKTKSVSKKTETKMNIPLVAIGAILLIGALILTLNGTSLDNTTDSTTDYTGDVATIDLYIMSQCPYGTQAEDSILPLKKTFGDALDINLEYISTDLGDGTFRSLHGQPETDENIVQLCIIENNPDKAFDFILCRNKNIRNANWKTCAEANGIETSQIQTCFDGEEGKDLLRVSLAKAEAIGAGASPTIVIDGSRYSGGRDAATLTRTICGIIPEHDVCVKVPKPVEIQFTVIGDKRCTEPSCDTSQVIDVTKQLFAGAKVTKIDYNSDEGKKLYDTLGLTYLPAYIFDSAVENGESFEQIKTALVQVGNLWYIVPEATMSVFDPKAEICDNGQDDNGNGIIDCEDSDCAGKLECREEVSATVDLFVMSQCPYGVLAEQNMKAVLDSFGDEITYNINFIASESNGVFSSLHGQAEVDEDMRQVCIAKNNPNEFVDYVLCIAANYRNAGSIWESCATSNGIDTSVINTCFADEGTKLLKDNIQMGNQLNIGSSPTFMINNRYMFGGAQPADYIQAQICTKNPDLTGCSDIIVSTDVSQATATGGC